MLVRAARTATRHALRDREDAGCPIECARRCDDGLSKRRVSVSVGTHESNKYANPASVYCDTRSA